MAIDRQQRKKNKRKQKQQERKREEERQRTTASVEDDCAKARRLLSNQRLEEALHLARKCLKKRPTLADAHGIALECAVRLNDLDLCYTLLCHAWDYNLITHKQHLAYLAKAAFDRHHLELGDEVLDELRNPSRYYSGFFSRKAQSELDHLQRLSHSANTREGLDQSAQKRAAGSSPTPSARPSAPVPPALPSELARALELPEEVTIADGGLDLTYGSPVLDRMVARATSRVPLVLAQIAPHYLKRAGFDQVLARDFSFPNSRVQVTGTAETRTTYLALMAHYSALSDERKEGLVETTVQERSGAVITDFCRLWPQTYPEFFAPGEVPPQFSSDLDRAVRTAMAQARAAARDALDGFLASMERRLHRGVRNTREYYSAPAAETTTGLDHPHLSEPQRRERQAKIDDLPREADGKIEDLKQKYQVRVVVKPAGAIRFLTRVVQVLVSLQHRKARRELSLTWNPVTQTLDPLVCESCDAAIRSVSARLEGDRVRLLCPACAV